MNLKTFLIIVGIQTFLSGLIAALALYKWKDRTEVVKLIGMLFALSFLCNFSALVVIRKYFPSFVNLPGSIYDLCLVPMLTLIYNAALHKKYARALTVIAILYVVGAVINLIFYQTVIASFNKLTISFVIIFCGVFYFYRLMKDLPTFHLTRLPMFWFNSAFLIYGSGALFLFAFLDYLVNVLNNNLLVYWTFHNLLLIFHQLLIIVGIAYEIGAAVKPSFERPKN